MTPLDKIDVGDYIAVSDYFGPEDYRGRQPQFDGAPLEVVAISLPFLGVILENRYMSIDTRVWGCTKLRPRYAQIMSTTRSYRKKRKTTSTGEDGHPRCVNCGARLRLKQSMDTQYKWVRFCPECGTESDPVPLE